MCRGLYVRARATWVYTSPEGLFRAPTNLCRTPLAFTISMPGGSNQPLPKMVEIRRGLRLVLTKNLDKKHDFVNGMRCEVVGWDESSRCLEVQTVTGKRLEVFQYTDPNTEAKNASFFPVRLGYAGTIYKLQGAELDHITIYLDVPGQRAAAYVAISRVRADSDYVFAGAYTRKHFVPNV
jgi:hypothetical protein